MKLITGYRNIFAWGLLLMGASMVFAAPFSPNRASYPDQFSVLGNRIVDSRQQEIVFRGVSAVDPLFQGMNEWAEDEVPWNEAYFQAIADWGATLVRIPIHPQFWRANSKEENFRILDQTLAWIAANNMYAIIDFHSIGYPPAEDFEAAYDGVYLTSMDEWKQFWSDIANHYRDNRTIVFYELFNEPVFPGYSFDVLSTVPNHVDWQEWRACVEDIVRSIQPVDSKKILIINGLSWAYDLSFVLSDPVRAEGIVYGTHPYPNSNWHTNWDSAFGNVKEKYPVMVTEFGFEISGDKSEVKYKGTRRYRDDIMSYLEDKGISWVAWSFSNKWSPALLADKNGNPNEAGHFFRDRLRR